MVIPDKISVDENNIMFRGQLSFKMRIKYKKRRDGFQADSICSNGYTFRFLSLASATPKKYLDKGFSPLHSTIMFMFDQLKPKK